MPCLPNLKESVIYNYTHALTFFFNLLFIIMTHSHLQVTSSVVFYSRIAEIRYEIEYGERKQYSAYSERTAILDMRSGTTTPRQPAFSASQSFA